MRRVCILVVLAACGSDDGIFGVDTGIPVPDGDLESSDAVTAIDAGYDADPAAPDAADPPTVYDANPAAPDAADPPTADAAVHLAGFVGTYEVTLGPFTCGAAGCCADAKQAGDAVLTKLTVPEYAGPGTKVAGESGWQWNLGNPSEGVMSAAPGSFLKLIDIHWITMPNTSLAGPLTFAQESNGDLAVVGPLQFVRWTGVGVQRACEMTYDAPVFRWIP